VAVEFVKVTPGKTRKVRITSATRVHSRHLEEGQVVEIAESDAYLLVHSGKAEFSAEPPRPEKGK
jgi:hypothetical protein